MAGNVIVRQANRRSMLGELWEVLAFRQALTEMVKRDMRVRYKRSALGLVWTMLSPLLMMVVTAIVFASFFRFAIENFAVYMLSAQILWQFFSQSTASACTSVLSGAGLARKIYLPPTLFPIAAVNGAAINLLLSLIPLALIAVVTGGHASWALLFVPVALALVLLFSYGVALILSASSVFFHDTVHLYQALLTAWMYLTPIFYPVEIVPPAWAPIFYLNPLYHLVTIFREPIYSGQWPDPTNVAAAAAYAFGTAALGWWYFERSRDRFAGYL